MSGPSIPMLSSIGSFADQSEAWIVDIWGVMHNGARAFAPAAEACARFRQQGGVVVLLSNAPRPFTAVVSQLDALGVARTAYDAGVTSGDVTRAMIAPWQGRPVLHIGPARDQGLFDGFALDFADARRAEMVVCSGLNDDSKETPQHYTELFEGLVARGVAMICANPDLVVERGDKLVYCAGALAAEYARLGGAVSYAGKPHWPVYERALAEIDNLSGRPIARNRVLAIGDGIDTDLLGAHRAGLRSVFIASAVHVPEGLSGATLSRLFAARPFTPVAALAALRW